MHDHDPAAKTHDPIAQHRARVLGEAARDMQEGPAATLTLEKGPDAGTHPRPTREALTPGPYSWTGVERKYADGPEAGRAALESYLQQLGREVDHGLAAQGLIHDLTALRGALPNELPPAASRALARMVQDSRAARRGLRP